MQRTMLELLNQLDGFSSTSDIKVSSGELKMKDDCRIYCSSAILPLSNTHANIHVQVIAATNRVDTLDPALLRSGTIYTCTYNCHIILKF